MNMQGNWLRGQLEVAAIRPRRVVVFGRRRGQWALALASGAPAWDGIRSLGEVELVADPRLLPWTRSFGSDRIVLPLRERDILRCADTGWGLKPSRQAVRTLSDKARFAAYARSVGLGGSVPAGDPPFPCIAKLARGHSGHGVAVVNSAAELLKLRFHPRWLGRRILLQALVEGSDHVFHAVCRGGRVLWHCAYSYELAGSEVIQRPGNIARRTRYLCSAEDIALFERFLVPLGYDGPVAIDFKRPGGRPCVIEINPRLGGSLKRAGNAGDLHDALATIVANAAPFAAAAPRRRLSPSLAFASLVRIVAPLFLAAGDLGVERGELLGPEAPEALQPAVDVAQGAGIEHTDAAGALGPDHGKA